MYRPTFTINSLGIDVLPTNLYNAKGVDDLFKRPLGMLLAFDYDYDSIAHAV